MTELTWLPTASGIERAVVDWVTGWVAERDDLRLETDTGGNLVITQRRQSPAAPVLAVAHMDHPAFVITDSNGDFEFRGGVDAPYFDDAEVDVVSRIDGPSGKVVSYDESEHRGSIEFEDEVSPGDIAMWRFPEPPQKVGRYHAPACDDLAGATAALAALDRARSHPELGHFGVLLTRAEEVGLIGALHAAKQRTIPEETRVISIETSRELPSALIGEGPIIRTGDRSTVFDRDMTNRITDAARQEGLVHQRRLMDGGGCEATAFGVFGYRSTGLCLALGNWHNRGNLAEVESGDHAAAVPKLEEISIDDFHGLIDLLLVAATSLDGPDARVDVLSELYESNRHYLG